MFLGLDIGTSGVKAVLTGDDGAVVAQAVGPLTVSRPAPMFSEQDPADWWAATNAAVLALPADLRARVRGVGVAGQMHGATLLDAADQVLRPAILWNDGRSQAECAQLEAAQPRSRQITGNAAMAGFTAPKLLWVRNHEPALFERVRSVLLPKDYVRLLMTGDKACDMADASGTLWLDVANRRWSDEMLAATGLTVEAMPTLFEGSQATGRLRPQVALAWGMGEVAVAAGGGDNAAAAVGLGVIDDGDAFISLGTSGVVFAATNALRADPDRGLHAFCHAVPDRWHQMSVMLSAASCLDWAAGNLIGATDVPQLLALAEASTGPTPLFLPYLTGERTPHADPAAQAVLFGLTADSDRGAVARAVLEGVAMGLRDGLDVMLAAGSTIDALTVAGGGARSTFWGRLIAAALERPLVYRAGGEVGPALGAARLARVAVGEASVADACAPPPILHTVDPEPALVRYFQDRQPRFRSLFSAIQPHFPEHA